MNRSSAGCRRDKPAPAASRRRTRRAALAAAIGFGAAGGFPFAAWPAPEAGSALAGNGGWHSPSAVVGLAAAAAAIALILALNAIVNRRTAQARTAEELFQNIFDGVKDAIFVESPDGRILNVNRAVCSMLGYSRSELLRRRVGELLPPALAARLPGTIREETLKDGVYLESENVRKDGVSVPVEVSCSRLKLEGKERILAIVRDVTERKRAGRALREAEERYRMLFRSSPDGIMLEDPWGRVIDVNPPVCEIFGYPREEMIGMDVLRLVPPEFHAGVGEHIARILSGEKLSHEVVNLTRDGRRIVVELKENKVRLSDGRDGIMLILRNVTERKELELELDHHRHHLASLVESRTRELTQAVASLEKAKKVLEEKNVELTKLDRLKSEFISIVSHELRTPLTSMREGASQLLDGILGEVPPEQREVLAIVLEEIDRLARIINDVLDISRIEAGKVILRRSRLDVSELAGKTVSRFRQAAEEKQVAIDARIPPGLPQVFADPDKLEQVLFNLIGNALKFTPRAGKITIAAEARNGWLEIVVADNGIGISPSDLTRIFEKFTQFAREEGGGAKGTGLGLAITKQLVGMHGGTIRAESELNRGTRIVFTLPDCSSEESLRGYLDSLLVAAGNNLSRPALFGVALENRAELSRAMGERYMAFFEKLCQTVGGEVDPRAQVWIFPDRGACVTAVENAEEDEPSRREEEVLRALARHRFRCRGEETSLLLKAAAGNGPGNGGDAAARLRALWERLSAARAVPVGGRPPRVLVVEDDPTARQLLSDFLAGEGMVPLAAESGEEALKIARAEPLDLVLLDICLPGISGYEVIQQLRAERGTATLPIISLSGYEVNSARLADRTIPTLAKPIELPRLARAISQVREKNTVSV